MVFYASSQDLYIAAASFHRDEAKQGIQSFVSVYKAQKYFAGGGYLLECQYRFEVPGLVSFLSLLEADLAILHWDGLRIINLLTRKEKARLNSNSRTLAWGFQLSESEANPSLYLTGRGLNFRAPLENSRRNVGLHIVRIERCALYNE